MFRRFTYALPDTRQLTGLLVLAGLLTLVAVCVHVVTIPPGPAPAGRVAEPADRGRFMSAEPRGWENIADWQLFGKFDATAVAQAKVVEPTGAEQAGADSGPPDDLDSVADTRLDLRLSGVLHAATKSARAILVVGGDTRQRTYAVGEQVVPGVEIYAIEARQVVVTHAGTYEAVRLPTVEAAADGRNPSRGGGPARAGALARND